VELHIEELLLHGFAPGERWRVEAGVHRELTRLLTERDLTAALDSGAVIESLDAGSFRLPAGGRAEAAGGQIARSVMAATRTALSPASPPDAGSAPLGDARR
jgi:hypothetical protein